MLNMAIDKKTRSVCIRVSAEELETLREACERAGTRTVSGLAREAMHRIVNARGYAPLPGQDIQSYLSELRRRLASLQSEVERLQTTFGYQAEP
jgi:hypothetical protein